MASIRFLDKAPFTARFKNIDFPTARIREKNSFNAKIDQDLPFRIRFTSIGIPGYAPPGFPGIGIQIIGYNNYIL